MDKSLDEIIKTKPRVRRPRRGGAKTQVTGNRQTAVATAAKVAKVAGKPAPPAVAQVAEKIIVSNLPVDVNETQLKELFVTTVGPVRNITLHYDAQGRWNGSATVHFQKKGDGTAAYNQYNNRLIDGRRPMKIEVVVDPSSVPPAASLVQRVAPARGAAANGAAPAAAPMEGIQRNSTRGRGRRPRGGRSKRPQKSAADLDAEMEDYTAGNAPAAGAASAPAAAA